MGKDKSYVSNHYVPRCYLNYFGHKKNDGKDYYLHVYDIDRDSNYNCSVERVCCKDNFYTISEDYIANHQDEKLTRTSIETDLFDCVIERNLGEQLAKFRGNLKEAIEKKCVSFQISEEEKLNFAIQIVYMYVRHPNQRNRILPTLKYGYKQVMDVFMNLVAKVENDPKIAELNLKYKSEDSVIHALLFNENLTLPTAKKIAQKKWHFLYKLDGSICTSDNPVQLYKPKDSRPIDLGLNAEGSIIFFPILPELLLVITDGSLETDDLPDKNFGECADAGLDLFNRLLVSNSKKIFSYNNHYEEIKSIIQWIKCE